MLKLIYIKLRLTSELKSDSFKKDKREFFHSLLKRFVLFHPSRHSFFSPDFHDANETKATLPYLSKKTIKKGTFQTAGRNSNKNIERKLAIFTMKIIIKIERYRFPLKSLIRKLQVIDSDI